MPVIDEALVRGFAPLRPDEGHKGTFGTALICAGSEFMTGAAVLSVESALRSGAGLVRILAPKEVLNAVAANNPCALLSSYENDVSGTIKTSLKILEKASSVAIGPGVDPDDRRVSALLEIFLKKASKLVVDASAISVLAHYNRELLPLLCDRVNNGLEPAVLTPHIGEFRRLLYVDGKFRDTDPNMEDLQAESTEFARRYSCIVVLKSNKTVISSPDGEWYIIEGNNSGMSKGGSGDVLTGLIAGFLAQGLLPLESAVSAVWFHSDAGRRAAERFGKRYMLPTDVIGELPECYAEAGW